MMEQVKGFSVTDEAEEETEDQLPQREQQSVPIRIALYVHTANVVWTLVVLLLGAIPYYHYWGAEVSRLGLIITAPGWVFSYLLTAIANANAREAVSVVCGMVWTIECAALVGFASALLFNIAPLQLIAISFGQSIAIVLYLQLSNSHNVQWRWAVPGMVIATACIWAASIYGFVVEDDWFYALGLALLAIALIVHNAHQLSKSVVYTMNEEGVVRAIMDYYVGDASAIIKRLQT